jgi:hypothetical protein
MSCVTRKKRNDQGSSLTTKFGRSNGTEAPKALTNLVSSYSNQLFDDIDFTRNLFFSCLDQLNTFEMYQIIAR